MRKDLFDAFCSSFLMVCWQPLTWFIEPWPQSVSLSSPGILPVCMSISRFPLFYKDSNHVGLDDHLTAVWTSQVALVVKNLPANAGDAGDAGDAGEAGNACLIPGSGRSPGGGHGNPLQYPYVENPMDRKPGGLQAIG